MKVLGLVGSPRKGGNTDLVMDAILYGAGASRHAVEKIYLYDANLLPCVDCRNCQKGAFNCIFKDDMQQIYPKLEEADVLVFGTPLYWYAPSAKMKLLMDRLRPYVSSKKLQGKKAVLVIPSEEGAKACAAVVSMFTASFDYLGIDIVGKILPKAYEKAEIKQQPKVLDEAFALGKALA
jgi:multimeric flavodoxin WrbA